MRTASYRLADGRARSEAPYGIDIAPGKDDALVLAVTVAVDPLSEVG